MGSCWEIADFSAFLCLSTHCGGPTLRLLNPVDKSVHPRIACESMLKLGKLRENRVEIMLGACAKAVGVEQVGVGDHGRPPLADATMPDQPLSADLAAAEQQPRRDRRDVVAAELPDLGPALVGRIEPQSPMAEQPGVHEHRRRAKRITQGPPA